MPNLQNTMLHLLLDCNVASISGVSTSVSSTLGYLLLFHPILEYPILRHRSKLLSLQSGAVGFNTGKGETKQAACLPAWLCIDAA